jgi:hypothetical protein
MAPSMFRETVRANESTDVEAAADRLREQCVAAGITTPMANLIAAQTRELLASLVSRGKQLAAQGSQLRVKRELAGDQYLVRIVFGAGESRRLWEKIFDRLRGR